MEEKLEKYRLRKRREEKIKEIKIKIRNMFTFGKEQETNNSHVVDLDNNKSKFLKSHIEESNDLPSIPENEFQLSTSDEEDEDADVLQINSNELKNQNNIFKYSLYFVFLLFWITLYIIAIEFGFGIVFLMFSALFGIYFNTRTEPKKRNEISAYSVFNKNCHSIDGTLKAEQFEQELRYGPAAVR